MKVKFLGGTSKVTGTKLTFTYRQKNFLVDYGLMQEGENLKSYKENMNLHGIEPKNIDYLLLTHSHIDHSGLIPYLYKKGSRGKIITHRVNKDILKYLLKDCAYILEKNYTQLIKKGISKKVIEKMYSEKDVKGTLKLIKGIEYNEEIELVNGLKVTYKDASHILGSSYIELEYEEGKQKHKVGLCWDMGRNDSFIHKGIQEISKCQTIITESTYGDRKHNNIEKQYEKLKEAINKTKGKVMIPCFALDRAQSLIFMIGKMKKEGKIDKDLKIYLDTPLGISIMNLYKKHNQYLKKDFYDILKDVQYIGVKDPKHSKIITEGNERGIYIAASGMGEHGRIRFHLEHGIENKDNTIVLVGYSVEGTLGSRIYKAKYGDKLLINRKMKRVFANIEKLSFSSHIDREGIIEIIEKSGCNKAILFHGSGNAKQSLRNQLEEDGIESIIAKSNFHYKV